MRSLVNICNISSVIIGIVLSCSFSFSFTMDARAFNAPPPRQIIGYQSTNPHCGKVFTNVFAYDQHCNHAARAVTLCASIMMREELTAVRRADRSSAVLSARPRRGNEEMCAQSEMRTGGWACRSADMFTRDPRQKFRRIQHTLRPCSKCIKIPLNSSDFFEHRSAFIWGPRGTHNF